MKVGSERQAASSPLGPNSAVAEIGYTTIANLHGGTLQNRPYYQGIYFQKPSKAKKIACFQDGSRVQAPGVLPTKNKLRELFYDRNPGDASVNARSEWKVFSRLPRQIPANSGVAEIACFK